MLKTFSLAIAVAAFALAASPLRAQQQEASLLKVDIPGQGFDLVFAMAKPGGARSELRGMPDPLVIYSGDGELAFAIDDKTLDMLKDVNVLYAPACTFRTSSAPGKSAPVSVYVVPKSEKPDAVRMASLDPPQPEPFMHKAEVPGTGLDIAFSTTRTPIAVRLGEPSSSLAVTPAGGEFAMAVADDVARMFKDVGHSELPDCAFNVEHKGVSPLQAVSVYVFSKN
jgi:hypothetical protein